MRRAFWVIVGLLVLVSGCGGSPGEPSQTSPTAQSSTTEDSQLVAPTTTPATTASSTMGASCRGCAQPPDLPIAEQSETGGKWVDATLSPGTYSTRVFEVPMSFTIDQPVSTLGESTSWISLSFSAGQHFVDFWGPSRLEGIDPAEWIQSQANERAGVRLLDVQQTTLFGRPATQIDVSMTDLSWYPIFAHEGQRWSGRTRLLVAEVGGEPLLVVVSGLSCSPFPLCSPDDEEANEYQFQKHLPRTEDLLTSVTF